MVRKLLYPFLPASVTCASSSANIQNVRVSPKTRSYMSARLVRTVLEMVGGTTRMVVSGSSSSFSFALRRFFLSRYSCSNRRMALSRALRVSFMMSPSMSAANDLPELCAPSMSTCNSRALRRESKKYLSRTRGHIAHSAARQAMKAATLRFLGAFPTTCRMISGNSWSLIKLTTLFIVLILF